MNDTHAQLAAKMRKMIQERSPAERLAWGCSMYDFSKELTKSSILGDNRDIAPKELRKLLFLRFYKQDFTPFQREKILQYLS